MSHCQSVAGRAALPPAVEPEAGRSPRLLTPSPLWPLSCRELEEFPVPPGLVLRAFLSSCQQPSPPAGPQGISSKAPVHFPRTLYSTMWLRANRINTHGITFQASLFEIFVLHPRKRTWARCFLRHLPARRHQGCCFDVFYSCLLTK